MSTPPLQIDPATGLRAGTFGFGTYAVDGRAFPALVTASGGMLDLSDRFADTHAVLADWPRHLDALAALVGRAESSDVRFGSVSCLPSLPHPNLLCAGANYKRHVVEMMSTIEAFKHLREPGESDESFWNRNTEVVERRAREGMPFLWTGLHSSLAGANDDVVLHHVGQHHDYELELAAVIGLSPGQPWRDLSRDEARGCIAAYCMANDLGTVDRFRRTDVMWGYDWISKHAPGFKPIGPFIVPAIFVDVPSVRIELQVNGEPRQDWPADDMIFDHPRMIEYLSERIRLMPGDLVLGGSPPGNSAYHGNKFLKPGDVITSHLTGLGYQRNTCVAKEVRR